MEVEDLSDFESFVKDYADNLKQNYGKIIKTRRIGEAFKNYFTYLNPELILDGNEFVPKLDIPCVERRHFYCTRLERENANAALFVKVSTYRADNYDGSGLELNFDVINKIAVVIESNHVREPKRKDADLLRLSTERDNTCSFAGRTFDMISYKTKENRREVTNYFFSDLKWEDRLPYRKVSEMPFIALPECIEEDNNFELDYNQNGIIDRKLYLPSTPRPNARNVEYEVQPTTSDLYASESWLPHEDDIVSTFADTSIVQFLISSEIPIWASIYVNSLNRPIKDNELTFLDEAVISLKDLSVKYPDALTVWAYETVYYFFRRLVKFKVLDTCKACRRLMRYRHNKKYCVTHSEGRACGKKKDDAAQYQIRKATKEKAAKAKEATKKKAVKKKVAKKKTVKKKAKGAGKKT